MPPESLRCQRRIARSAGPCLTELVDEHNADGSTVLVAVAIPLSDSTVPKMWSA
jgi:hypothetical protein